jgi:hypothetical protein
MHRLIFSINSGRSGSEYLSHLLNTGNKVTAFHEPKPGMAGRYLPLFPAQRPSAKSMILYVPIQMKKQRKIGVIKEVLKSLPPDHIYAETNHMFILSFYDVVMKHFKSVDVILLRRYLPRILKSFLDLDIFGKNRHSRYWTTSPNMQSAAVPALAPDEELDQVDLCIAFLIDIEARAQRFKRRYPEARVVEVRLESLNDWDNVFGFFSQLGIEPTDATRSILGSVANSKTRVKRQEKISEEYCRKRIFQYLKRCEEKGIALPELPHLEEPIEASKTSDKAAHCET